MAVILTERDARLLKDVALSHVLSRDQIIRLGYFGSVSRVNTRLRVLKELGFLRKVETPFFTQSLYVSGLNALEVVGPRIAALLTGRSPSPRFLQHALAVTNIRLALIDKGADDWRFEQQLRAEFAFGGRRYEARPDGMALFGDRAVLVEADMGHVAPAKFAEKLSGYAAFQASGECLRRWQLEDFDLLCVTTGKLRASRLTALLPNTSRSAFSCTTFDELGAGIVGGWS